MKTAASSAYRDSRSLVVLSRRGIRRPSSIAH
jgi:hypothetical protein